MYSLRTLCLCGIILTLLFSALPSESDQLLPNTGFEDWSEVLGSLMPDGWYTTAILDSASASRSTDAHNGNYSLNLSQEGFIFGSFSNDDLIRVEGSNPYDFSIWTRNILSAGVLWFIQYNADTSIAFDTLMIPLSFGWSKTSTTITTEPEALFMVVGATVIFGSISFDDVDLNGNPGGISEGIEIKAQPMSLRLFQNKPNPFNKLTAISYQLRDPSHISLKIYDINGRIIKTLLYEEKKAGIHTVPWDGLNLRGENVPPGVYFYRLSVGQLTDTKKLIILK
jgi:hypothetical protein